MNDSLENSTFSANVTEAQCIPFTKDDSTPVKAVKAACYVLIMLLSLFGNAAVIAIVVKNRSMRTTTNYLITNMAVSDFMLSAFAVPRELTEIFIGFQRWLIDGIAGMALCKLVYFLQDISTAVSIQSIVIITIDRYTGVVTPYRKPVITPRRCKFVIPLIWVISMGLHGSYFYIFRQRQFNNSSICFYSWEPAFDHLQAQRIYFTFVSVTIIAIPLAVITVLYLLLFRAIRRQNSFWRTLSSFRLRRRKENTVIMKKILAIISLFVICILPIDILGFVFLFVKFKKMPCKIDQISFAAKFILYSNASLNPCVYFLLNGRYRQGLQKILKYRDSLLHERKMNDMIQCMM